MKTTSNFRSIFLITVASLLITYDGYSQGSVTFANRGGLSTTATPGQVYAPVYREDPGDPTHRISGNTATGVPGGPTSYHGASPIDGNQGLTFVATLWGRISTNVTGTAVQNNLEWLEHGTTTFRTNASASFAGIWSVPQFTAPVPGADTVDHRGTFQVRVWDTRGGLIKTWDEVMLPENNNVLRGYSELFTVPWTLGDVGAPPSTPPYLQGLESFNVFIVPEPSVVVLGLLGLAGWFGFLWRRRQ